ncbi:MAG: cell division protein FtsQ/DivIB [Patescibacteria group bacterium]
MIRDFSLVNYKSKIRIKKDYRKKKFDNPYFNSSHKKEGVKGFNTKLYLKIIFVVFLIYLVVYSDLFKIKTITINGADLINKTELEQIVDEQINSWRWFMLPQKNLLFLSKKKIIQAINAKYGLAEIEIKRGWKKITVNIKEKVNYLIVNNNEKLFFVDKQGIVIREVPQEEANQYLGEFPILNMTGEVNIGDSIVSSKMVDFILKLNEKIKNLGIEINDYRSGGLNEITLITKAGWQAHFDINNDFDTSIENMQMVLNNKVKDTSKLEYIDLRFGDKIYYK